MRMMVVTSVKRNQKSSPPNNTVFHFARYGSATRGLGPRNLRTRAHKRKNIPHQNQALNTPERNQSSRWPCCRAANTKAKPRLRYKNPTKLGAGPVFLRGGVGGMPTYTQRIMMGAMAG